MDWVKVKRSIKSKENNKNGKCRICGKSIEENSFSPTIKNQKICDACHGKTAYNKYARENKNAENN